MARHRQRPRAGGDGARRGPQRGRPGAGPSLSVMFGAVAADAGIDWPQRGVVMSGRPSGAILIDLHLAGLWAWLRPRVRVDVLPGA